MSFVCAEYCAECDPRKEIGRHVRNAALDEAKRAVCRACDAGWEIDPDPEYAPDLMHIIPMELREPPMDTARGTRYSCDAAAIEALKT